eukprot:3475838-Pyramimonas_sp.AAC.1
MLGSSPGEQRRRRITGRALDVLAVKLVWGSREARKGGYRGTYRSIADAREPQNPTKGEEYQKHLQEFPGASSMCNVRVPWTPAWTNPSPVRSTGVQCGNAKGRLGFHSSAPLGVQRIVQVKGTRSS